MFVFQIRQETPAFVYAIRDRNSGEVFGIGQTLELNAAIVSAAEMLGTSDLEVVSTIDTRDAAISRIMSPKEFNKPILN